MKNHQISKRNGSGKCLVEKSFTDCQSPRQLYSLLRQVVKYGQVCLLCRSSVLYSANTPHLQIVTLIHFLITCSIETLESPFLNVFQRNCPHCLAQNTHSLINPGSCHVVTMSPSRDSCQTAWFIQNNSQPLMEEFGPHGRKTGHTNRRFVERVLHITLRGWVKSCSNRIQSLLINGGPCMKAIFGRS
jgi:hypothetical protein